MNLNKAFVLGRVTRDPEIRALPSGQQVANFGMATNRYYTDNAGQKKEETEFHNIVAFGKTADIIQRYVAKGTLLLIEGRIKTRNWVNSAGAKQYRTEIIVDSMQLGPKNSGAQPGENSGVKASFASNPSQQQNSVKEPEIPIIEENYTPPVQDNSSPLSDMPTDEIDVKDIPF
jgi:single-strand DNA-binding protein